MGKRIGRKLLSLALALAMLCTLFPGTVLTASAEEEYYTGTCGDKLTWQFFYDSDMEYGELYIRGSGAMTDFGSSESPWYPYRDRIDIVQFPDKMTSIGDHAFEGCTVLTSVNIPAKTERIGSNAFSGCTGLTSFTVRNPLCEVDSEYL